jgi:hypothetical protein
MNTRYFIQRHYRLPKHFFINCARNILFKHIIYTTFLVINYFADYYLLSVSFSLQLKQITDQLFLTSLLALFVFCLCKLTSGVFTIDSSTSTLRMNTRSDTYLYKFLLLQIHRLRYFYSESEINCNLD